jgi:hypothetical protein
MPKVWVNGRSSVRRGLAWLLALMLVFAHSGIGPLPGDGSVETALFGDVCSSSGHGQDQSAPPAGDPSGHGAACALHCSAVPAAVVPPQPSVGPRLALVRAAGQAAVASAVPKRAWRTSHPPRAPPVLLAA